MEPNPLGWTISRLCRSADRGGSNLTVGALIFRLPRAQGWHGHRGPRVLSGRATRIERVRGFEMAEKAAGYLAYLREAPEGPAAARVGRGGREARARVSEAATRSSC